MGIVHTFNVCLFSKNTKLFKAFRGDQRGDWSQFNERLLQNIDTQMRCKYIVSATTDQKS